ncbi:hypothetical protein J4E89_010029 [Alternaria sp. Ai002NY15]|nr:hypothetical protein J4E89_010029 [Alternaria sp. Ai002NY15]
MRLLRRSSDSARFSLVQRFKEEIPPYAILSHTWGEDEDEVAFSDLRNEQARTILGYSKLVFCSDQAAKDKLEFFWVDTCCIDKSSSTELTEAINSMFKWYQRAEKCYVLLSDVEPDIPIGDMSQQEWQHMLHSSRWFQRGWTLQELLAPKVVEFFSKSGTRLGDKVSLLQTLHRRTQVPVPALQGCSLSHFSIDERISWMKGRETKRDEDAAYSLLGLLDVHMPLLYGEGHELALARLRRKAVRSMNGRALLEASAPHPWVVPFARNDGFVDRDCLKEVYQRCSQPAGSVILLGPAGVGKTQIAIEYTYRLRDQTPSRWSFWINATTRASFEESYHAIANTVKMKHWDNPKDHELAQGLKDPLPGSVIIKVMAMNATKAPASIGKELGPPAYRDQALRLLDILDSTSPATKQTAAATIRRRAHAESSHHSNQRHGSISMQSPFSNNVQAAADQSVESNPGNEMLESSPDMSKIADRLTETIEDLHNLLSAIRAVQFEQKVTSSSLSEPSPVIDTEQSKHVESIAPLSQTQTTEIRSCSKPINKASIAASTNSLVQLGLSISDINLLINEGIKFGDSVRAGLNDHDIFDLLDEAPEVLRKVYRLVDAIEMEKRWPTMEFTPQSVKGGKQKKNMPDGVDRFTWIMVAITSALDECLPSSEIQKLLFDVFFEVLDRDDDVTSALGVTIRTNIESWRSFGCAREIAFAIKKEMRKSLANGTSDQSLARAIPQLNEAETEHTRHMLIWLLNGDVAVFNALSPITFSIAEALRKVNLDLCTNGRPAHEGQACVTYHHEGQSLALSCFDTSSVPRGLSSRPLQISWPRDKPESMIDALGVDRSLENVMNQSWQRGKAAAYTIGLVGQADGPYGATQEVYYSLEVYDHAQVSKTDAPHIGMLANQGLPADTQSTYSALGWILEGEPADSCRWLQDHVAQDYLLRVDNVDVLPQDLYKRVYLKYQAFLFGFYYELLVQLLSFDFVEPTTFFQGIWGANSTTFLAMCTQLGRCWRRDEKVSRAHMLYVLSTMYNGRRKIFDATSKLPRLVGVLGPISVLTLPLVRTTDDPREISMIAIVDLPIVDLCAEDADGDLMASEGGGIHFESPGKDDRPTTITQPAGPTDKWTVHPRMSMILGGDGTSGVVMAARCGKRLVGWFNPLAADISFLSPAYVRESYSEGNVVAFEVKDEHWKAGKVLQPSLSNQGSAFGVVRSHNSPSLRYAAAGFYAERGEEIAIARSATEFRGAFDRIEAQDRGMIIA